MYRTILILVIAVLAYSCFPATVSLAQNRNFVQENLRDEVNKYFAKLGAFGTFINRGQRAADVYRLPQFEIDPRREKCFPKYSGGPIRPQNPQSERSTTQLAVSGSVNISRAVKAEIKAKVRLMESVSVDIKEMEMEDPDYSMFKSNFEYKSCPEIAFIMQNQHGDGEHIVIRDVYYATGSVSTSIKLSLSGGLSVEAEKYLSGWLKKFGLPVPKLSAEGEFENLGGSQLPLKKNVAIAIRPLYLNEDDFNEIYSKYLESGVDKRLALALTNQNEVPAFFENEPELEKMSSQIFMNFAEKGKLLPYDPENQRQRSYVSFLTNLAVAHRIMKSLEAK